MYTQLVHRQERRDAAASAGHPDAARRTDLGAIPSDSARPGREGPAGVVPSTLSSRTPRLQGAEMLHCIQHDIRGMTRWE